MRDIASEGTSQQQSGFPWPSDRLVGTAILIVAVLLQLQIFDRTIVPMDEGHLAAVAAGLQDGKLLYRDLHTGIFPGIYHLTALLFSLLGNDLVVARWAEVGVNAAIALLLWLAGVRIMRRGWALVAPALYLALVPVSFPVLTMFNYSSLSLVLCMASLYFSIRLLDEGAASSGIGLGVCLALAVFCKQNFGALAFLAVVIALIWNRRHSALAERSWGAILLPIAGAGLSVTFAFVVYFVATGTLMDFLNATVIQLGGDQMQSFNNPIPPLLGSHPLDDSRFIFIYSPPFLFNKMIHGETLLGMQVNTAMQSVAIRLSYAVPIVTLCLGPLIWFFDVGNSTERERLGVRVVVVFASLFFLGIFPSAVWSHLAFVLPPILLLMGLVAARFDDALRPHSAARSSALRGAVAALVAIAAIAGVMASADISRWHSTSLDLPRGHLRVTPEQAMLYRSAVAFVDQCAAERGSVCGGGRGHLRGSDHARRLLPERA
ncbi:MAG: glycosyltransferase family 39 protein [Deltaproteobacteria bacterium]|nr:glycosyltransferase family 39 protein [Deltaproteobacteria bacterium]